MIEGITVNFGVIDRRFLAKSIGQLSPPEPVSVPEDVSIDVVLSLLERHRIGCVVVVDPLGKISGIFSERDVVLKVYPRKLNTSEVLIREVMTVNPHTEQMTTSVAYALNMMSEGGYRHIPIADEEGLPIGIISVKNIVDYIVSALNEDLETFC